MSDDLRYDQHPEPWSAGAAGYEESITPLTRLYAATCLDLLGVTQDAPVLRLLDVAAGTGALSVEAARRGARVLATDFAPGMVDVLRRRFKAEGLDGRAEVMDGQALALDDATFDVGTSTFGLMFFPDPAAGLRELYRVLRPGGRVGIVTWDIADFGLLSMVAAALDRVLPDRPAPPPPSWAPLGSVDGIRDALQDAGFADVAPHQVTHFWHLQDPGTFFRHLPDWTPPLQPLFASLPVDVIDHSARAFREIVEDHTTSDGLPAAALVAIGRRA